MKLRGGAGLTERQASPAPSGQQVTVEPLTPARWPDVEALFGEKGACAGCWCMFWRLGRGERFDDLKGARAKRRFKALVMRGKAQGLLAYRDRAPVGWLSLGPRRDFAKLDRAPSLACDDSDQVHSLPCFFVLPGARGQGVATALLDAAVRSLEKAGARIVEGYPVKPARPGEKIPAAFAYTGTLPLFEKAGFTVVAPRPTGRQRARKVLPAPGGRNTSSRPLKRPAK
ncbi:MAG: GNAT family N-acetyltransferase [Archangium sp.]|nr:GNAT family N-acetyltransferase [Archangium sp.]